MNILETVLSDNPASIADQALIKDGNGILGHIFGSKDVSRNVAGRAAEQTGISSAILRKMLPMVATLVVGALSKKASGLDMFDAVLGDSSPQPRS